MSRLYLLGEIMADVLVHLPGPLALGADTPAPIRFTGGGSAANTAAWLAHSGVRPILIARVGDDPPGISERQALQRYGVELAVGVDPHEPTGSCVVLVHPGLDGPERTMIPNTGANGALRPEHLPPFEPQCLLYVSSYAFFTGARAAALTAIDRVRDGGGRIVIGASSASLLIAAGTDAFLGWVGRDVLLLANGDEAAALTGELDQQTACAALTRLVAAAVVTCGPRGAYVGTANGVAHMGAAALADAPFDTVGAGDAFAAGLLRALHTGDDLPTAARVGNQLAARSVSHVGGRPPL